MNVIQALTSSVLLVFYTHVSFGNVIALNKSKDEEIEVEEKSLSLDQPRFLRRRATVVLHEDFSSGHLDPNVWEYDIMVDNPGSFDIYSNDPRNSYFKNGMFYIHPTLTTDKFGNNIMEHGTIDAVKEWGACHPKWGGCVTHDHRNRPIMSVRLRTHGNKGQIKYGRVEVKAKLPKGDWLWPAIWMMPVEPGHYGPWPRSGEIDILETTGNLHYTRNDGTPVGPSRDAAHYNYGVERPLGPQHAHKTGEYNLPNGKTFGDNFHTFWCDWTEDHINLGVDDVTVLATNTPTHGYWQDAHFSGTNVWAHGGHNAPFDRPFYLIINLATGGNFFYSGFNNRDYPRPWTTNANENGFREFWNNRHQWLPTWHGEDITMRIKDVKLMQY